MIPFLIFLQIGAASPPPAAPTFVVIRDGASVVSVPVTVDAGQASVRADALAKAMHGILITSTNLHYALSLPRMRFELIDGIPFTKLDTLTIPLTRAPQVRGGQLYLPLQFVSDVIPKYGRGYLYDAGTAELRATTGVVAARPAAGRTASSTPPTIAVGPPRPDNRPPGRTVYAKPITRKMVVIDAGHGGPDNGMTGPIGTRPWFLEKDVTLAVALKLATVLRARGVDVLMTRTTDTLIALYDRGKIANSNHGDVFISIHVNAPGYSTAAAARERGFETYFLAEAKTEGERRVQDMENESVKFETGANAPKGDPLNFIITDMAQNEHLRESSDLAQTIQNGMIDVHPGPNRGVQQANFAVLRGSYMPAVLVEIGFGSNQSEATFLSDQDNQRALARNIASSVLSYLEHYDTRVGGTR
ncbi:MAG: N-acetylmuramoyl-L-alanine amidase family protein [Gemmatimonadaceae bacterium]